MRSNPETSSGISVFANGAQRLGYVVAFLSVGPLLAAGMFRLLFGVTAGEREKKGEKMVVAMIHLILFC